VAKKIDPKAKAKKQKIIAGVLGALLVGVLAFQGPRTLKMLHQSSASASPAATTTAATATGATGATGALAATAAAGSTAGGDGVNDPGVLPAPQSGQLLAFSRFRSKDPFTQQINIKCAGDAASSAGCGASTAAQPSGTTTGKTKPTGSGSTTPISTGGAGAVKLSSAEISVNGISESVAINAKFPASNPTFVLVSLTKKSAKIGISGGSLEGSKQTVTLKKGVALTLMNTADGTRYVLRLVSVS
jgi:hypothetical protein